MKRIASFVAAATVLSAGFTPALASAATASATVTQHAAAAAGTKLWSAAFTGGTGRSGSGSSVAVNPSQPITYVSGMTRNTTGVAHSAIATVAYNSSTGAQLWTDTYANSSRHHVYTPYITVSPDGSTVFVVTDLHTKALWSYLVFAYNATTGAQLWMAQTPDSTSAQVAKDPVTVSPDSSQVFVTGTELHHTKKWFTVAYNAQTGAQNWTTTTTFTRHDYEASAITVSPDGADVFVTGTTGTVAYSTATGAQLWDYAKGDRSAPPTIVASPDSAAVYVTQYVQYAGHRGWLTTSIDAATGQANWVTRYSGPGDRAEVPASLAVTPDGSQVIVAGTLLKAKETSEFHTIAYNAATGATNWGATYTGNASADNDPVDVAVTPNGSEVAVTGFSGSADEGYLTVTYNTATGAQNWVRKQREGTYSSDPAAIAVTPDSSEIIVTGTSGANRYPGPGEYLTVAYQS
jgi:outer membrane protein assembly factor BamB